MFDLHTDTPPDIRQAWLDVVGTPGLVADGHGRILAWNRAATAALGWTQEQVSGEEPRFVSAATWRALASTFGNPAMANEWGANQLELRCADERAALSHLAVSPLAGARSDSPHWVVLFTDFQIAAERTVHQDTLIDRALSHGQGNWLSEQVRRMAQRAEIFERILHRSPGILLVLRRERDWPVEYVSSNIDRFGYERDALLTGAMRLTELFHPDDLDRVHTEIDFHCEQTDTEEFRLEFRWMKAHGEARWMDTHLWLRRDAQKRVTRLQGIAWDITDRKQSEARQRLTTHVVEVLNCPQDNNDALRNTLETFREFTGLEAAAIHLRQPSGGYDCDHVGFEDRLPLSPESCSMARDVAAGRLHPNDSANASSARCNGESAPESATWHGTAGRSIWTNGGQELSCAPDCRACARNDGSPTDQLAHGSLALVPLRAGGQVVGILQLYDRRPDRFDRASIESYESLGYSIGIALDRELATRRLRASEERYRALFDTSGDGILMYGLDGRIEMANPALLRVAGRPLRELRSMSAWRFLRNGAVTDSSVCQPGKLLRDGYTDDHEREILRADGSTVNVVSRTWVVRDDSGTPVRRLEVLRDVSREREAERKIRRLATAIEQSADSVLITDDHGRIEYVNPAFETATGYVNDEALGMRIGRLRSPEHSSSEYRALWESLRRGEAHTGRFVIRRRDGSLLTVDNTASPVRDTTGRVTNFVAVQRDMTKLMQLEMQLLHAQKLESIGRLAAGIAHEINTPSQYVGDNVRFLKEAFEDYDRVMTAGRELALAVAAEGLFTDQLADLRAVTEEADFGYLAEEIPRAIDQSLEGLSRISGIVGAMKYFSHPGADEISLVDIHKAIESTVTVARNEWKYDADLELDFDPELPLVPCLPNEFNQVVLNLVINAVHAIQAKQNSPTEKGRIVIRTRMQRNEVVIEVEDSGTGVPEFARPKLFDPFFTTKQVGRGTGQGLALAHDVIVHRHGGRIEFETELGVGTTFRIHLPLEEATRRLPVTEEVLA